MLSLWPLHYYMYAVFMATALLHVCCLYGHCTTTCMLSLWPLHYYMYAVFMATALLHVCCLYGHCTATCMLSLWPLHYYMYAVFMATGERYCTCCLHNSHHIWTPIPHHIWNPNIFGPRYSGNINAPTCFLLTQHPGIQCISEKKVRLLYVLHYVWISHAFSAITTNTYIPWQQSARWVGCSPHHLIPYVYVISIVDTYTQKATSIKLWQP